MNTIARALGFRFAEPGSARFSWGEVAWRGWGLGLNVNCYDDRWWLAIKPIFGSLHIRLWRKPGATLGDDINYGFSWYWGREWGWGDSLRFQWGTRYKTIDMPWGWVWQRTSLLAEDGRSWIHELKDFSKLHPDIPPVEMPKKPGSWFFLKDLPHWQDTQPYFYVLRSGERQDREATISVCEMEWRMRALQWLPWPRLVRRSIEVTFSDEVGERAGSWKGGCTGCGYELKSGEMARECLKRMEQERKFA